MNEPKEEAAEGVAAPAAANVVLLKNRVRSVPGTGQAGKAAAFDPESPESLLRHAWALLPIFMRGKPVARFLMPCAATRSERRHFAELMPDLSMRVVESYSGRVVAESAPLLPKEAPR